MNNKDTHVYSAEKSSNLDSSLRNIIQNPYKILKPFIKRGMTVVDLGCGPGFFTLPMAELTDKEGKVIAIDIQAKMLENLQEKITASGVTNIEIINSADQTFEAINKVDFILAAYVIHELPNRKEWLNTLYNSLKKGGLLLVIEPNVVVSRNDFIQTKELVLDTGFELIKKPCVLFSKVILAKKRM